MPIKNNLERFNKIFSEIIEEDFSLSKESLDKLKFYVDFKTIKIFFISNDNLEEIYPKKNNIKISTKLAKELFNEKYKTLKLLSNNNHYITYLKIKGSIYGLVLFEKNDFTEEEKVILKTLTKIISYKIKDIELSEIFNTQLTTLSKAAIEAKNAEKIKTEFISKISHELRTPLNSILGFTEILNNPKTGTLTEKQSEYVKDIQKSSVHLLEMINEVLDMSKIENGYNKSVKQLFKINQAVTEVTNILYPLIKEKNIKLIQRIEDIEIYSDYQKIKQICFNLLSNAIKFTQNEIIIEITQDSKMNSISIKIKDNGIGIDKKNHKKIFKKFTQIKDKQVTKESSTGLGLTITKEFITMLNGKITVDSELNKGSSFNITLPIK